MRSHFFDLNILLKVNSQPWVVDRSNPSVPLLKISESDFNLFKSGVFKNQGNKLEFNERVFWLPTEFWEKIKIKAKINKVDVSNLAISMQEYLNKDIINNLDFDLNLDMLKPIINSNDDIYIICSKNTKVNYQKGIEKLEEKMSEIGLSVKNFYYITETFFNKDNDDVTFKKTRLVLQHLVGFKTDGLKFTNEEVVQYSDIFYYDDDFGVVNNMKMMGNTLQVLWTKTEEEGVKKQIEEIIRHKTCRLFLNFWTGNSVNRFKTERVDIKWSSIVTTFESFKNLNR